MSAGCKKGSKGDLGVGRSRSASRTVAPPSFLNMVASPIELFAERDRLAKGSSMALGN